MERPVSFALFLIIGFFAQFTDGALGMGYGVLSASLLISMGILPALASAAVHTAEIGTALVSGLSHLKFGNVRKDWLLLLIIPGSLGGATGAWFLASVPGHTMVPFVASILLIMGLMVLYRFAQSEKSNALPVSAAIPVPIPAASVRPQISRRRLAGIGFVAALVDAVGGGGWGPIATPTLILSQHEEPRKVIGTVNLAEFFITVVIAATFFTALGTEEYDWGMIGTLLLGGVIAAPIAAYVCRLVPPRPLGIMVGIALIAFNVRTLLITLL
ncbi:MAG: sulfite exporter TauE/SafE family protein [Dehalococcoidia bacterium]|nr:sulfite exporter TauE/SafE family protein [Dehalococcoidia bacterium]